MAGGERADGELEPGRLGRVEPLVADVRLVDDLPDPLEGGIVELLDAQDPLEAAVTDVV